MSMMITILLVSIKCFLIFPNYIQNKQLYRGHLGDDDDEYDDDNRSGEEDDGLHLCHLQGEDCCRGEDNYDNNDEDDDDEHDPDDTDDALNNWNIYNNIIILDIL